MKKNIINDDLLIAFKKGEVSKKGVHTRTNFRMAIQNILDSLDDLFDEEKWQLSTSEIVELEKVKDRLKMMQEE